MLRPIPAAWRAVDGGTSNLGFMSEVGFREATVAAFGLAGEQPVHRVPEGSGGAGAHLLQAVAEAIRALLERRRLPAVA